MSIFDFFKLKKKPEIKVSVSIHEYSQNELRKQQDEAVKEIKKLNEKTFPSENGLYPYEILMLYYAPKYCYNENKFPQFWYYKYAVDNPQKLLISLMERGFIRVVNANESIDILKIDELKKILSDEGLKTTGKKADLVKTVKEEISEEKLLKIVSKRKYVLTELGESEIKDNEYVIYLHNYKYDNISIWEINERLQGHPKQLWRDIIWGALNQLTLEASASMAKGSFGLYINNRYQMAEFVLEEKKFDSALNLITDALYYEILYKCVKDYQHEIELRHQKIVKEPLESFPDYVSSFTNYGIKKLNETFLLLNIEKEKRGEHLLECYKDNQFSNIGISKENFVDLLLSQIDGNISSFNHLCKIIEKFQQTNKKPSS